MSAELSSIATKVVDKKTARSSALSALMKAGMDDKLFEEKLKKAIDKNAKDGSKPMIVSIKQDSKAIPMSSQVEQKANQKASTSQVDEQKEMVFRQVFAFSKLNGELNSEKNIKELRDIAKSEKKLSKLLEKLDNDGLRATIKVETLTDDDKEQSKKIKKSGDQKNLELDAKTKTIQEQTKKAADEEKNKKAEPNSDIKDLETKTKNAMEKDRAKADSDIATALRNSKKTADELEAQKNQIKKESEAKSGATKNSIDDSRVDKKMSDELDTQKNHARRDAQNDVELSKTQIKKETKEQTVEVKKDEPKQIKTDDKKSIDTKAEVADIKKDQSELLAQKGVTKDQLPVIKTDDKTNAQTKKIDEKPASLQDLLTSLTDIHTKKDDSLEKKKDGESKREQQNDEKWSANASSMGVIGEAKNIEDSIAQKIKDAPTVLKNFTDDLKDRIDEYKPPIMKVSMELRPENMAPVDVTMITRGQNLIININSSDEALKMFMSNANDFRQNLMNIGFTEMTMNFSFKDQSGERRQYQYQEQSKKYKEIAESSSISVTDIEVIVPRYA